MLLIGMEEIKERYRVSRWAINSWMQDGAPFMRIGKRVAVDDEQLNAWLLQHRPTGDQDQKTCQVQ